MEGRGGVRRLLRPAVSGEAASVVSSGAVFTRRALLLELRALDSHMLSRQQRHRGLSAFVASLVESATLAGSSCPSREHGQHGSSVSAVQSPQAQSSGRPSPSRWRHRTDRRQIEDRQTT